MKIHIELKSSRQAGNALLMVLILAVITLPIMWGMLDMNVKTQHRSVARSQNWNGVLPLVEAGVEEGLAHLNRNCYSNTVNGGNVRWFGVDGWTEVSNGVYQAEQKHVGSSYYDVWITTNAPASSDRPDIICRAYSPTLFSRLGLTPLYGAVGQTVNAQSMLARQVRVGTFKYNLFTMGILAEGNIRFNGQGGLDSFDSQSPTNSFYGLYDPRYHSDNAQIGSTGGSIDLGAQGVVYGEALTSPSGSLTNGTIGDIGWVEGGNSGTQDGKYQNDLNMSLLDVELPYGAESWPLLSICNCVVTITNPVREAKLLTSPTYPSPPPPGGVIATNTLLVTTDYYPGSAASDIETNYTVITSATYPNPEPEFGVRTNASDAWVVNVISTNMANFNHPVTFVTPPGVVTNTEVKTNVDIAPLFGTYAGAVTIEVINPQGSGKKDLYTNYIHNAIQSFAYMAPESFTWTNETYSYLTETGYKYIGAVTNEVIETRAYKYVTTAGDWRLQSLSLGGQERMLVRAPGHTTLYVSGQIDMRGQSQIIIEYGASISIYVGGDVNLGGQGIMNENDNALNFSLYGLPTCTSISIGGNASLTGTIYAPQAHIRANGGGRDTHDIIGAIVGASVTFNGHFNLHYDEALGRNGPTLGYVATSWIEESVQ